MAHQRRMKKDARRARLEKAAQQLESPDVYRHPDPSSTNPHWDDEIALGPGPPPRGRKKGRRNTRTAPSRVNSNSDGDDGGGDCLTAAIETGMLPPGSDIIVNDDRWNRRDPREDDDTWRSKTMGLRCGMKPASRASSTTGMGGLSRPSTGRSVSESCCSARSPPADERQAPVITTLPPNSNDHDWMLAPPPSAKIMDGKRRASPASRSASRASSRAEASLRREMSERGITEKLRRGEVPDARPECLQPDGARRRPVTAGSDCLNDTLVHNKRHDSGNHLAILSPNIDRPRRKHPANPHPPVAGRPAIVRASTQIELKSPVPPKENIRELPSRPKTTRPMGKPEPVIIRDSSLNLLQELVSPLSVLNSQFAKSPTVEARIQLPPTNSVEELQLRSLSPWFPADDFLAASHGCDSNYARSAHYRWSMDV